MPSWILPILKWLAKLGPIAYDLTKITVKIIKEWRKLENPAKEIVKEYRRDQQKKKTSPDHSL